MPEEWFDVAYINFDKAVLHGRARNPDRSEREVEVVLTLNQKRAIEDLNFKHQQEMQKLLREMVA